jgi:hypothetical protein
MLIPEAFSLSNHMKSDIESTGSFAPKLSTEAWAIFLCPFQDFSPRVHYYSLSHATSLVDVLKGTKLAGCFPVGVTRLDYNLFCFIPVIDSPVPPPPPSPNNKQIRGCVNFIPKRIHRELEFLNVYGAQESIPRNQFRQPK